MMMVKASREGIMSVNLNKRPFVLTRSNFIGGHRYAATWTGDNGATWDFLKMSIPMSLNLGLSGQAFNGPDIGGFDGNATSDLFGHWISVGSLLPFARAHTIDGSNNQEPWEFGEAVENASRTALERRYRLLPYFYSLFEEASRNMMPVMRPLFFADPTDKQLRKEQQAFLIGDYIMVIPKWAKDVQMPKGNWRSINLLSEDLEDDGFQPKLKIKEGAVVPVGSIIQSTEDYNLETIELYISLNSDGKAKGRLYADAGNGYGYEKGEFVDIEFSAETRDSKVFVKSKYLTKGFELNNKVVKIKLHTDNGIYRGKGNLNETIVIEL
jgi:alpha-glucosidase